MGLVDNHPHTWPAPLQPLEHREFRLLWTGTFISNAGSWMQRIATAWLVYSLTQSPAWLGVEAFASGIPTVLLLPLGGVIADRVDRRRLLIGAHVVNMAIAAGLAATWWMGVLNVWGIIAASFLSGVVSALAVPANQSVLPAVVGKEHLPGAIALNSLQYNLARALGPALGGVALLWGGPGWCFALNGASYLALIGAFAFIRNVPAPEKQRGSIARSIGEGVTFLRSQNTLLRKLALVGALAFCASPIVSMLPALAREVLSRDASAYSMMLTAFGVGAAIAGIVILLAHSKMPPPWIQSAALLVGACQVAAALSSSLSLSTLLVACAGAGFVGAMIGLGTTLMQETPDSFRGRVSSVQQVICRSAQPGGALVAGLLAQQVGLRAVFISFGITLLVLAALTTFRSPPRSAP